MIADETTLPTLAPGSGKTQKAWRWAYARDDRPFGGNGPPMVAYRFEDSRGGECIERHLAGFAGILLRAARQRELALGDADRHDDGWAVGDRGRHPRPGSCNAGEGAPGKVYTSGDGP